MQFNQDVATELNIYKDLVTYFTNKGNNDLRVKYGIPAFNLQNLFSQQSQKASLSKQILDQAISIEIQAKNAIATSETLIAASKSTCATNLANLKKVLNEKLALAASLKAQISAKDQIVANTLVELAAKLEQLKKITAELYALADQYALIVA